MEVGLRRASPLSLFLAVAILYAALLLGPRPANAICLATELTPCAGALGKSAPPPSNLCCTKLKEQQGCLCQYLRSPIIKTYFTTEDAERISTACGVPTPSC